MVGLFLQIAHRDEHREIGVLRACGFDAGIHFLLHGFPEGVSIGTDYHSASHWAVVGQFSFGYDILIPAREIFGWRGERRRFCHQNILLLSTRPALPALFHLPCPVPLALRSPAADEFYLGFCGIHIFALRFQQGVAVFFGFTLGSFGVHTS